MCRGLELPGRGFEYVQGCGSGELLYLEYKQWPSRVDSESGKSSEASLSCRALARLMLLILA